jgi:anti-sigma factor RsiW
MAIPQSLSKPPSKRLWVCPNLEAVSLDGCTSLSSEALRSFVESRLPAHVHARKAPPPRGGVSSTSASVFAASSAAAAAAAFGAGATTPHLQGGVPSRLRALDVTRCHQLSKETIQWLRMFVSEVKCEPPVGPWAEAVWQQCD